jgi:hypothetical protein
MARLVQEARQRRVGVFTARILGENRNALRLVAALFATVQARYEQGECQVRAPVATLRPVGLCSC